MMGRTLPADLMLVFVASRGGGPAVQATDSVALFCRAV